MKNSASSSAIRVTFSVNGKPVAIEVTAPNRRVRIDELLPTLLAIDDRLIEATVADREAAGERISCAKGCTACCRTQPVPITPPEAMALARLVDALPEPEQSTVRRAFAAAAERLRGAGLYDFYMQQDRETTREAAIEIVRRYIALALPCPFLKDTVCTAYASRPFVCRQYLVTSPPDFCEAPLDNPVQPVRVPAAFATAVLEATETISGHTQLTIPLVLALSYVEANRAELERTYDSESAFGKIMRALQS